MKELMISIMNSYGYLGVFLLILIENIFPPIPSEVILLFGGFMTTYTSLNVLGMTTSSTFGSVLGALILYKIGSLFNRETLKSQKEYLENKYQAEIVLLDIMSIDISSTIIRKRIKEEKRVDFFLPNKVLEYINYNNLYRGD